MHCNLTSELHKNYLTALLNITLTSITTTVYQPTDNDKKRN